MKTALQSLVQVPGVLGAAVFDGENACLAEMLEPPYEPILLSEALGRLREVLDNYVAIDDSGVGAAVLVFGEGHCLIRMLNGISVVVLASESANLAMLGVALNVAALKCSRAANGKSAKISMVDISRSGVDSMPQGQLQDLDHSVVEALANKSQSFVKQKKKKKAKGSRGSRSTALSVSWAVEGYKLPPPPGAVGLAVMRHVLKSLMRQIGREGKPLLEEELHRIGATPATVTAGQFTDLIVAVARRIPSPGARDAFMSDALGDNR